MSFHTYLLGLHGTSGMTRSRSCSRETQPSRPARDPGRLALTTCWVFLFCSSSISQVPEMRKSEPAPSRGAVARLVPRGRLESTEASQLDLRNLGANRLDPTGTVVPRHEEKK